MNLPQDEAESGAPRSGLGALLVLWPVAVWIALSAGSARTTGLVLIAVLAVLTWLAIRGDRASAARPLVPALGLAALTAATGSERFLFFQPVVVNLAIAVAFGASLRPGAVPLCERIARGIAELPPGGAAHCRQFTWAWFVFALANAAVACGLAAAGDRNAWAALTGPASYVGVVMLLAVEWTVRRRRFGPTPRTKEPGEGATIARRWTRRTESR